MYARPYASVCVPKRFKRKIATAARLSERIAYQRVNGATKRSAVRLPSSHQPTSIWRTRTYIPWFT